MSTKGDVRLQISFLSMSPSTCYVNRLETEDE